MAITCLVAEVTGDLSLVVPTMLSIALAREVAALIQHEAFTHDILEVLGLPFSRQNSLHRNPWGVGLAAGGSSEEHKVPGSPASEEEDDGGTAGAIGVLVAGGGEARV